MSYVLKFNGEQVAISGGWNPLMFGNYTRTSYPANVDQSYVWEQDGWSLGWEDDPAPLPPTTEQIIAGLTAEVQEHLDATAQSKGYDSIVSACSYAGAPNPFQAESQAFVTWRGNVWTTCYQIMADVQSGARAIPSDLISELPQFNG